MNKAEVFVKIPIEGDLEISVKGAKGVDCHDLTKNLESALGIISKSMPTREARSKTSVEHKQKTSS